MKQRLSLLLILLAILGFAVSAYSFFHNAGLASGEFCTIGETFNCDVVNKGPYSQIAGIPVALMGMIGYVFMALAAFLKWREPDNKRLTLFLLVLTGGGLLFSLYLSGIEAFVLKTWCLLCLTSQTLILALFVGSVIVHKHERV